MRYFVVPIVLGLLLIGAFNIYVDPGNRWHRGHPTVEQNWGRTECRLAPEQLDERKFRASHIKLIEAPDVVLMGSSRGFLVDSEMFAPNVKLYNNALSGASMWDYAWAWQLLKETGKTPKYLLLFADTWNFNKNTWQKYRWISNYTLFDRFLRGSSESGWPLARIWLNSAKELSTGTFAELLEPFSPAVLRNSITVLPKILRHEHDDFAVVPIAARPPEYPAWRSDGSRIYPQSDLTPLTTEKIREVANNIGLGSLYVYMLNWETDPDAVAIFKLLLDDAAAAGTKVLVVEPPFQHQTLAIMHRRPEYRDIPGIYEGIVRDAIAGRPGMDFCNALDPAEFACTETEFMDSAHALRPCVEKMLRSCINKVPAWTKLLGGEGSDVSGSARTAPVPPRSTGA